LNKKAERTILHSPLGLYISIV